jgi:hypothetical protein
MRISPPSTDRLIHPTQLTPMKQIVKLDNKHYIQLDSYSGTSIKTMVANFFIVCVTTGLIAVVTGAMLGTDLTKPLYQWSEQRQNSTTLR